MTEYFISVVFYMEGSQELIDYVVMLSVGGWIKKTFLLCLPL